MTTTSNQLPSRLSFLAGASALLACALLTACGTRLTPTVAEVAGREVEIVEAGKGAATVVFESGLGDDWTPWDEVASEVAAQAQVFAYSRPGYGASDSTSEPRDATHIVHELRVLLEARGYSPPYVLVGHSFGGTYMELFAKAHPDEVAALVLVETRHRDFAAACKDAGLRGCGIPASAVADLARVERDESHAFARSSDEMAAAGEFGSYPVRVLTGTSHDGFAQKVEALWVSMHGALAEEAADGDQRIFRGAEHYLQLDEPEEVVETILSVLPEAGI
jgi:pimeloyl-ACP methyl ester carboxylesterase